MVARKISLSYHETSNIKNSYLDKRIFIAELKSQNNFVQFYSI